MSSEGFHENEAQLRPQTKDLHRAIVSLMEELEAIDWYQQRMDATANGELRTILRHNRDEEIEHAALLLEWIRRRSPEFDAGLRPRLFTDAPLAALEASVGDHASHETPAAGNGSGTTPTVGSPRKGTPWTTRGASSPRQGSTWTT